MVAFYLKKSNQGLLKRSKKTWWQCASKEQKDKLLKSLNLPTLIAGKTRFVQKWETIGDKRCYFRSSWEIEFANHLQGKKEKGLILDWLHEPKTFWFEGIKRGCVSYLPDFQQFNLDSTHEWFEVKGWMDPKSATKIKRFGKFFPKEKLTVISGDWFKKKTCRKLSPKKLTAALPNA